MIIGGLDEAGRGSILGPLVVAGVSAHKDTLNEFVELGVKDSKLLSPQKRIILYTEILRVSSFAVPLHIQPQEIDLYVEHGKKYRKLNYLEAIYMARVADQLKAERVFVDSPDTNPKRFAKELLELMKTGSDIVAEHHADRKYPIVSAASIIAKVERDRSIEKLRKKHGDFGSGYPSDPETRRFLSAWFEREASIPDFARKSWKSWKRILQSKL